MKKWVAVSVLAAFGASGLGAPPIEGTGTQGDYKLTITGQLQFQYIAGHSEGYGEEDYVHGFERARTRLKAAAEMGDRVGFVFQFDFPSSQTIRTLDALLSVDLTDRLSVHIGQGSLPFSREYLTSSSRLLAVDRSVNDRVFGLARSEMVEFEWTGEELRLQLAASDGRGATNSAYTAASEADLALTGRIEWLPIGSWRQFRDQAAFRGQDDGLLIGLAGHVQTGGETGGTADTDIVQATADVGFESDGWGITALGHARHTDAGGEDFSDFGALVQAGVFVSEQTELFARYDVVLPDADRPDDEDGMFQSITVGANHYFVPDSHALKLTVDASWYPDHESDSLVDPSTGTDILASDRSQFVFRVQVQVLF